MIRAIIVVRSKRECHTDTSRQQEVEDYILYRFPTLDIPSQWMQQDQENIDTDDRVAERREIRILRISNPKRRTIYHYGGGCRVSGSVSGFTNSNLFYVPRSKLHDRIRSNYLITIKMDSVLVDLFHTRFLFRTKDPTTNNRLRRFLRIRRIEVVIPVKPGSHWHLPLSPISLESYFEDQTITSSWCNRSAWIVVLMRLD